jgi:GNAT superfamily N-acetyltransferase
MGTEIRPATMADRKRMARTLASAFEHDPTFGYLFPDDRSRFRRLEGFFDMAAPHLGLRHGASFLTEDGDAAAVWVPPDQWRMPITTQLRMLPGFLRWAGRHTPRVLGAFNQMEKAHPHEPPSWYLLALGTEREHQGKGLGSALVQDMLGRIDEQGLPAYLESSNPRNVPFYARHGFVEREPMRFGGADGPVVTPMWREAR